jgi:hypothetical protein
MEFKCSFIEVSFGREFSKRAVEWILGRKM